MKSIIMTSPKIDGYISFEYNEADIIEKLEISGTLTDQQYAWLFSRFPWKYDQLPAFSRQAPDAVFTETEREITFKMFWDRYDDKVKSSKKKTESKWNNMTKANQVKAYLYIPTYFRTKGSADKKYTTTYLEAELWNN